MRILAGLMASVLLSAAISAASAAEVTESRKEWFASSIAISGLHCPTVLSVEKQGEDASGMTVKITCASTDGKSSWFIRALLNESYAPRYSAWEANPPQWTKQEPATWTLKRRGDDQ
jgi:hypothetical protein